MYKYIFVKCYFYCASLFLENGSIFSMFYRCLMSLLLPGFPTIPKSFKASRSLLGDILSYFEDHFCDFYLFLFSPFSYRFVQMLFCVTPMFTATKIYFYSISSSTRGNFG